MLGITSYGAYIPRYRINHKVIASAMGFLGAGSLPGEKAVANYDEDSTTMAVAAGFDCLSGMKREKIGGLFLATVNPPYMLRQNAAIAASALDLPSGIRTADFTGATKSGTSALLSALDAARGEEGKLFMACASDCRVGKPGSGLEHAYGDGAAAIMVGSDDLIATLEGSYSLTYDFPDRWRADGDRFEHPWEDRFSRDEGYTKIILEAISGLVKKYKLTTKDIAKVIYACPYAREHQAIAKQLGAEANQVQDPMLNTVGDTGAAYALMMLVAALEDAKPGDKIIVASYGSGADALLFQVTDKITKMKNKRGIKKHLASKKDLTSYERYLAFRHLMPFETGIRGEVPAPTSMTVVWRERKEIQSFVGAKCKKCGTPQYPPMRICVNPDCGAVDEMEDYRFSDRKGVLFSYTGDNLAFSISPPAINGVVDFEGGGRAWLDMTDCELESMKVGLPLEITFRKKYFDPARGVHSYFWKATPIRA